MKKVINIRRVSSFRTKEQTPEAGGSASVSRASSVRGRGGVRGGRGSREARPDTSSPMRGCSSGRDTPGELEEQTVPKGD